MKKSVKKKREIVEYLLRVDLEELGIDENYYEELKGRQWTVNIPKEITSYSYLVQIFVKS